MPAIFNSRALYIWIPPFANSDAGIAGVQVMCQFNSSSGNFSVNTGTETPGMGNSVHLDDTAIKLYGGLRFD